MGQSVTKDQALKALLQGACHLPRVGSPITALTTSDLIWAEDHGITSPVEGLPVWLLSKAGYGDASGSGSGSGDGYGDGSGSGSGDGYGDGSGYGSGYGDGSGSGSGDGYGDGSGSGDGYGYGYGYGSGSGSGYGDGSGDLGKKIIAIQTAIDRRTRRQPEGKDGDKR